jgi:hypothetical protein
MVTVNGSGLTSADRLERGILPGPWLLLSPGAPQSPTRISRAWTVALAVVAVGVTASGVAAMADARPTTARMPRSFRADRLTPASGDRRGTHPMLTVNTMGFCAWLPFPATEP